MIHKTAVIDASAIIEENVAIGAYTVIGEGVTIKSGTVIGSNAYIEHAEIEKNCRIFHSASIGTEPQDLSYKGEPTKIYIGEGTTVREGAMLNRGTAKSGKTVIGKNCYLMMSSHVAHDARLGDNVIMVSGSLIAGHVEVGDSVFISGLVAIHQFTRIGKGAMLSGGTMATMDIIPYSTASDRAKLTGLNLVGLKRRGTPAAEIKNIKDAYKTLFMSNMLLNEAVTELEKSESVYVREIIDFIKSSKRGIARPE